jgi:pilus assembly protein CpaB
MERALKGKIIPMIGIAAVIGAVSIFAADYWIRSSAESRVESLSAEIEVPAAPKVEFKTIVVAKEPLRYGMALDAAMLAEIPWPQDALPSGAFPKVEALLAGGARVVLSPMEPNEPILLGKLSGANGRASLSNLLAPGMRAVTIKTDEIAGVGGFVTPGDRVDIVLTRDAGRITEVEKNAQGATGSTLTSEIVLENVKILSVGQGADERQSAPQVASSVTLEVNADGAQKIALARNIGSLSLSLRSSSEGGTDAKGLTTISAFGGSVAGAVTAAASSVTEVFSAPEEPKTRTIVVTRGTAESQSYEVPSR